MPEICLLLNPRPPATSTFVPRIYFIGICKARHYTELSTAITHKDIKVIRIGRASEKKDTHFGQLANKYIHLLLATALLKY